ncbi:MULTISPECIES: hypothetical protein [Pectobacterium]|uniref:hypothetical protein n=1 Tax=Pectobacterium TaxID=122277 RepID=UPI000D4B1A35|nr:MULTISPECIES: hypothetical protein [Pectobacterium]MCA6962408.1 hypothetical protein [Pectobacterium odoriferum]MCH5010505.1 hypothetical protein [Pectobacterium odoriferum]POY58576.1 hypothetical protein PB70LOC_01926 [Pectobacterium versatile]POY62441.1 hypothetical protein PB69LOC_03235 [Pectobacterium versatile]
MSEWGIFTYVNGTSFDASNAISSRYIIDVMPNVQGAGSKTYQAGLNLSFRCISGVSGGNQTFNVSTSGATINWNLTGMTTIVVYIDGVHNDLADDFGIQIFKGGKLIMTPKATPYALVKVLDLPAGNFGLYVTDLNYDDNHMIFFRNSNTSGGGPFGSATLYTLKRTQAGKLALQCVLNNTPIRIYFFSKKIVNAPDWGLFVYNEGQMVWHSNVLPLIIEEEPYVQNIATPYAVASMTSSYVEIQSPGVPRFDYIYRCSGAGPNQDGTGYIVQPNGYGYNMGFVNDNARYRWGIPNIPVIKTEIYDQYYQQALGY